MEWYLFADATVIYLDRGCSSGMERGVARARRYGVEIEERWIGDNDPAPKGWQRVVEIIRSSKNRFLFDRIIA